MPMRPLSIRRAGSSPLPAVRSHSAPRVRHNQLILEPLNGIFDERYAV
jgi:hypothetical protein